MLKVYKQCIQQENQIFIMNFKILFVFLTILVGFQFSRAENIIYKDYIFKEGIASVVFHKSGTTNSYPVLDLSNTEDELLLSFDDLSAVYKSMQYTIVHCERDWSKSDLMNSDYLEGTTVENVINYEPSFNTYQKYMHYWLSVPTNYMRPKLAGNYILILHVTGDENDIILTRRFYVVDNRVTIRATIKQPTYARYRNTKQEIDFEVNYGNYEIRNPMNDIKIVIRQNQRWDNQLSFDRPQFIRDNVLIYDFDEENLFDGYGEFRNLDARSYKYPGYGVNKIRLDSYYHLYLFIDQDRSIMSYSNWSDIDGDFILSGQDKDIPVNELDYVFVHFSLDSPFPPEEGNVYIFGGLTNWKIGDKYKLRYNTETKLYELVLKLKQGYYNYQYVTIDTTNNTIDPARFEGSHFETENNYLLCVYYHMPTLSTDLLIGVSYLNSDVNR